jgi:hypothetical protein
MPNHLLLIFILLDFRLHYVCWLYSSCCFSFYYLNSFLQDHYQVLLILQSLRLRFRTHSCLRFEVPDFSLDVKFHFHIHSVQPLILPPRHLHPHILQMTQHRRYLASSLQFLLIMLSLIL